MSYILDINYARTAGTARTATSASYALTASYALNGGGGGSINTSSLATTGSNTFIGNQIITGSINTTGSSTIIGNFVVKSTPSETYLTIDTNYYQLNIPSTTFGSGASVDWYNRLLYKSSLATPVLDWENGVLLDTGNNYSIHWSNRQLYDAGFPSTVLSVDWGSRLLYDYTGTANSLDWASRLLYDTTGVTLSIDWSNRTLNDSTGTTVLNYFGGGGYITFTGTSSYATYAETASFIIGGATTGSNTFIGNQNILDNYLYVTSSTTPRFSELTNEYISFYDDVNNVNDRYTYVGFDGISLVSGSDNRLDIAVNGLAFGSLWAGSVFQVRDNLFNPVDVIKFENYNNWTDGKVIFDTPISASVGITASSVSINNILTLTPQDPLPASPTGTIAVSASTPPKPYFYDGSTWNALY